MTLKHKYEILINTGQLELSKEEFKELNELHKEKFHKNIKRDCGDCAVRGLKAVFGEQPKRVKQTFPKHEPIQSETKSEIYGTLGDASSMQYFNNIQNLIRQATRKLKEPIQTALHYHCFNGAYVFGLHRNGIDVIGYDKRAVGKDYKEFIESKGGLKSKGLITKAVPKKQDFDLLIYLLGDIEELDKLIEKYNPKFVHTHLPLENPIKIIPTLPEGTLYKL